MAEFPIYQYVQYGAISLNDPELPNSLEEWYGVEDVLDLLPADTLSTLQEEKAYIVQNKVSGAVGIVSAADLVLNYEEPEEDSEGFRVLGQSILAQIINGIQDIDVEEKSDEFVEGVNSALEVFMNIQESLHAEI